MKAKLLILAVLIGGGILTATQFSTLTNNGNGAWYNLQQVENSCLPADDSNITSCLVTNPADINTTLISENDWDHYGDDGDVKYAYGKWIVTRNGSQIDSSDWNKLSLEENTQGAETTVQDISTITTDFSKIQEYVNQKVYYKDSNGETHYYDTETGDSFSSSINGQNIVFGNFTDFEGNNAMYVNNNNELFVHYLENSTSQTIGSGITIEDQGDQVKASNVGSEISTCKELDQDIRSNPNGDYYLSGNIDCTESDFWNGGDGFIPISSFSGTLDGNGYDINGLYIRNSNSVRDSTGLFANLKSGSKVVNLGLTNVDIKASEGSPTDSHNLGAVAGDVHSTNGIKRVHVSGQLEHTGDGVTNSGGIAGRLSSGTISNSYSTADVSGNNKVAGLVGRIDWGGNIEKSYATGSLSAMFDKGGLVGWSDGAGNYEITNSYWDTETTGVSSTYGGGTGLTTSEMTGSSASTNMNFNFMDVWTTVSSDYPELRDTVNIASTTYYNYTDFPTKTLGDMDSDGTDEYINDLSGDQIEVTDGSNGVTLNATSYETVQGEVYYGENDLNKFEYVSVPVTTNATINHEFDREWSQAGEYSYTMKIVEAESDYYTENTTWSDYTITEKAEYSYPFEIVKAGDTPSPTTALQNWFDSVIDDIINSVSQIFDDNPTEIPDTRYN